MKKLILLILLIPSLVYGAAGDVASIGGKAITAIASIDGKTNAVIASFNGKPVSDGDGATCQATPFYDTSSGSSTVTFNANFSADAYYAGGVITPSVTKDVCKMEIRISCPYGTCNTNYYVSVFTMSGTALDASQGVSDATAGTDWTEGLVAFNFSTPITMTASTAYGVAVHGTTQSENNLIKLYSKDDGGDDLSKQWKSDKTQNDTTATQLMVRFYAYE
ncbi:MAG: hypothetical protein WC373_09130 [Smithella sp.]|jgi:hypothetical protein